MLNKSLKLLIIFAFFAFIGSTTTKKIYAFSYICGGNITCLQDDIDFPARIKRACGNSSDHRCIGTCPSGYSQISYNCTVTCKPESSWQCPTAPFNCGANEEKWCDDCGGVSCKDIGGGGGGGGGGDPDPDAAVCGSECDPGGVGTSGCGTDLSCAPDIHCSAGDAYKGDCGNPGDACGPSDSGGYCYRACWGAVCGGGGDTTCTAKSPKATTLVSPANGAATGLIDVTLKWKSISSWGVGCPSNSNQFKAYVKKRPAGGTCPYTGYTNVCTKSQDKVSCIANDLSPNSEYCWYVLTDNGSKVTSSAVRWFSTDKAPTASITAPATNTYFQQGTQISFSGTANDIDSPLNNLKLFRINENINHNIAGNWIRIDTTQTCTTQTCTINRNWTPASNDVRCWDVRIDAVDSVGVTCSGYPSLNSSWVDCGKMDNIKVCVNANVQGWIWDSTNRSCSYGNKKGAEIKTSEATGVVPYIVGPPQVNGIWNPDIYNDYSYKIDNVRPGNQTLCAQPVATYPGFRYTLTCINNSTAPGGSCAPITVNQNPQSADLGYILTSTGWFASFDGDVFGGSGSGFSVVDGVPSSVAATYVGYLVKGKGTVFGIADLSVKKQPGNTDVYSEDSNRYVKNIGSPSFWPANYNLTPPPDATLISNCSNILTSGNLNPTVTYKVDIGCLQSVLNSGDILYKLNSDGVAVIYVTGSGSLTFKNNFQSNAGANSKRRILFVATLPVVYAKNVGYPLSPSSSSRSQIESAVITNGTVSFPSNDPAADSTIMVEGPIISKSGIAFNRDRKTMNNYPAEVIKYNALYLDKISTTSGLFLNDAIWEKDQ